MHRTLTLTTDRLLARATGQGVGGKLHKGRGICDCEQGGALKDRNGRRDRCGPGGEETAPSRGKRGLKLHRKGGCPAEPMSKGSSMMANVPAGPGPNTQPSLDKPWPVQDDSPTQHLHRAAAWGHRKDTSLHVRRPGKPSEN